MSVYLLPFHSKMLLSRRPGPKLMEFCLRMQSSELWKVIQFLRLSQPENTLHMQILRICVFFKRTASENLKTKDCVCPHVGEPGYPLNVSQMLFRSVGARAARLLEWLIYRVSPRFSFSDFFSTPPPRRDGSRPLRLLSSGCYRQRRELSCRLCHILR